MSLCLASLLHLLLKTCFQCQAYCNSKSFYFSFTRTFAYYTIRDRLPDILTKVIDEFSRKASDHHRNEAEVNVFLCDTLFSTKAELGLFSKFLFPLAEGFIKQINKNCKISDQLALVVKFTLHCTKNEVFH